MASSVPIIILSVFLCFFFSLSFSNAQSSFRPRALVLPVQKDAATLQYVTKINQRTPSVSLNVVVDLGGQFFWVDCQNNYVSSTYRPVRCRSSQCSLVTIGTSGYCLDCFLPAGPGCNNNTCTIVHENPATHFVTDGEAAQDVLTLTSTDGSNPGRLVAVPQFIFSCSRTFQLESLASGTVGVAGLGRDRAALPSQLASAFSFPRKFAICLSGSTRVPGVLFFGDSPYNFLPNIQAASFLKYTTLLINPVSTAVAHRLGEKSDEYFIGVKSIRINNKPVKLNTTLLSFDKNGNGGTKISTSEPYTVLESSIFKAVTEAFITEAAALNIARVAGVAPFEVCFSSDNVVSTRLGARVPQIDLVLQNSNVVWSIFGSNSMVSVNDDKVLCLGFVDGGSGPIVGNQPRTSIEIGGHQLEDNLLQFDLATSRLGFTSTLLGARTTCANFNFTSAA
ncbi:OLC1v1007406C1 [Oldenlandia corymbosa var. corymbosa]|uniref:OLC1v1007406C1 n=1 Tax=Oldenlandia corymbosa var. corymbosa TaxID=529605 RepID=A0AAV1DLY2_OLDCO|nr:OLC1v1007406C1 [Oldenlandia corymbosa var. corymbosa]